MSVFRKLRFFLRCAPEERRLTVEAFFLPIAIALGFGITGVPNTQAMLRQWSRPRRRVPADDAANKIRRACVAQQRVRRATGIEGPAS